MMNKIRHFLPICTLVLVVGLPAWAAATELDEVVVTASRRPVASDNISSALSLIKSEEVQNQKLVTDALASTVGVSLQQTTPGQGAAIIRGLKGSAILHLVDGMPLSNAIFRSAPTPYLAYVPTTAIERIEVIRGTPASLYGSQAVGGVIQVISRVPSFDSATTEFRRDVALIMDTAEQQQSVKAALDFGNNRLAASLSGEYLKTGDRRIGGGEKISPSGYESKAARFVISATPSDDRSWLFDLQFLEQPKTPRIDELVPGFGQTEPSSSEFFFAPSRRLFAHAQHVAESSAFDLDWRFDAAWQRIDDDRITRDYEASDRRREANSSDLFALSINASAERDSISWISGIDIQSDEVRSARSSEDIADMIPVSIASRFPDGSRINQFALYANASWSIADHHLLSGGLRVSDIRIDVSQTGVNDATEIEVRRLSGDVGWIVDLDDTWQFVSNVGFGFRAPNISDLGTLGNRPGNRFNIPNTDLGAESVQQFDVGIRRNGESHLFELMIYTLKFDNRITSVLTGDVTPDGRDIVQSVNANETSIHGAEAGFNADLSDYIRLQATLNYAWGREINAGDPAQPADRIPPLSGRISLLADLNAAVTLEGWFASADAQNRLSDRDIRDVRINPDGTPGWAIAGAKATWMPNDIWQVQLVADNLLDKRYRVHGSGIESPGRNFLLSVRATW